MKKKILTILIGGLMILGLAGCGNNSDELSAEEKEDIVAQIESHIEQDRKSQEDGYKNSYEATVTNIEIEDLDVTFSGKLQIKYSDGSENNEATFEGECTLKPNPYAIYNVDVEYDY